MIDKVGTVRRANKATSCGCKPGTYANGWREVRSAECARKEQSIFTKVINNFLFKR